eukprot:2944103-Karenia_brevis.AAC.1
MSLFSANQLPKRVTNMHRHLVNVPVCIHNDLRVFAENGKSGMKDELRNHLEFQCEAQGHK